jgi:hypothetical protein
MRITLDIPDELAPALIPEGQNPAHVALEAWGLEAFRERRLSSYQLRVLLGIESRYELDGFLKQHRVETYTVDEWEKDWTAIQEHRAQRKADIPA